MGSLVPGEGLEVLLNVRMGVLESLGGGTVCGSNKKYEGVCRAGAMSGAGGAGGRESVCVCVWM